jgi:hypothetical protein
MLIIFLIIVSITICLIAAFKAYKYLESIGLAVLFFLLYSGISFLVGLGIVATVVSTLPKEENIYYLDIVSLKNDNSISGNFFLGSGSIQQEEYYFYFVKAKDGSFYRDKVEADRTRIVQTANISPRCEWKEITHISNATTKFWIGTGDLFFERKDFKLYVPPDTIIENFRLE